MNGPEVDRYYERLVEPNELRKRGETSVALRVALELLRLVPALIEENTSLYGCFDLTSVPPIEEGCVLAAILGDASALDEMEAMVAGHLELEPWHTVVARGREDMAIVASLRQHLISEPGTIQSGLGHVLGCDGRSISRLVGYMSQAGQVRREARGSSYALYLR